MKCDYCGKEARLVLGYVIYPDHPDVKNKLYWQCVPCKARVGCHEGSTEPLGRMANKELRFWKMRVHEAFDPMWKSKNITRTQAYRWLAKKLGIKKNNCHIGMFDIKRCKQAIEILTNHKEKT